MCVDAEAPTFAHHMMQPGAWGRMRVPCESPLKMLLAVLCWLCCAGCTVLEGGSASIRTSDSPGLLVSCCVTPVLCACAVLPQPLSMAARESTRSTASSSPGRAPPSLPPSGTWPTVNQASGRGPTALVPPCSSCSCLAFPRGVALSRVFSALPADHTSARACCKSLVNSAELGEPRRALLP